MIYHARSMLRLLVVRKKPQSQVCATVIYDIKNNDPKLDSVGNEMVDIMVDNSEKGCIGYGMYYSIEVWIPVFKTNDFRYWRRSKGDKGCFTNMEKLGQGYLFSPVT